MPRGRRGVEFHSSTPIVILLIGLLIVLYMLFLPPAQREALLSGSGGGGVYGTGGGVATSGSATTLMDKYVGTLLAPSSATQEHTIPSTTVFIAVNTQEIKYIDSLNVQRSAFSNQEAELTFNADPSSSTGYLLTFNVQSADGPLYLSLNGHPIFERVITSRSPEPIKLPQEYLQAENTITFTAGSAGWQFWSANRYELQNILVSADVASYQGASSEQHFTITPDEYPRIDKATLNYVAQCNPKDTGRLTVTVNSKALYSGYADCGVLTQQDISADMLNIGDNKVGFTSSQGSYTIDNIKVVSQLTQQDYPTFYFNLPPDMFEQANVFAGQVVLTIRFTEGNTLKQGSIVVNGFQDTFQTNNYYYQATLDPNVLIPNANAIQLVPQNSALNIAELRVELQG